MLKEELIKQHFQITLDPSINRNKFLHIIRCNLLLKSSIKEHYNFLYL